MWGTELCPDMFLRGFTQTVPCLEEFCIKINCIYGVGG